MIHYGVANHSKEKNNKVFGGKIINTAISGIVNFTKTAITLTTGLSELSKMNFKGVVTGFAEGLKIANKEGVSLLTVLSNDDFKSAVSGKTVKGIGMTAASASALISTITAGVSLAIGATVGVISYFKQLHEEQERLAEEARRASIEAGNAAKEEADKLTQLYSSYVALNNITDKTATQENEYKTVHSDIITLLGSRADALKILKEGTEEYTQALKELTDEELKQNQIDILSGLKAAEESLTKASVDQFKVRADDLKGFGVKYADISGIEDIIGQYVKVVNTYGGAFGIQKTGTDTILQAPDDVTGRLQYYADLQKAQRSLYDEYKRLEAAGEEEAAQAILNGNVYKYLGDTINSLETSIEDVIKMKASDALITYQLNNGIPKTTEELDNMQVAVFNATGVHEQFREQVYQIVTNALPSFQDGIKSTKDAIEEYATSFDDAIKAYKAVGKEATYTNELLRNNAAGSAKKAIDELGNAVVDASKKYAEGTISLEEFERVTLAFESAQRQLEMTMHEYLTNTLSEYIDAHKTLKDVQEDFKDGNGLTIESFKSLITLMPSLENALSNYLLGIISEKELRQEVTSAIEQQMLATQEEARFAAIMALEKVKLLIEAYGWDFEEFKTVEQLKIAITNSSVLAQYDDYEERNAQLSEIYRVDLENFKTVEQAKIAVHNAASKAKIDALQKGLNTAMGSMSPSEIAAAAKQTEAQIKLLKSQMIDDNIASILFDPQSLGSLSGFDLSGKLDTRNGQEKKEDKTDHWKEAAEAELATLKHLRAMEKITDQQYYDGLDAIQKKYYEGNAEYIKEERSLLEELYSLQKQIASDRISDLEHNLAILERLNETITQELSHTANVETVYRRQ